VKGHGIRIEPYNHSETSKFVIEGYKVNGKRKRFFFPTRSKAEVQLARLKLIQRAEGDAGASIGTELRIEAGQCTRALTPFGKTITDATNFLIEHLKEAEKARASLTVGRLIKERLTKLQSAKRSQVHLDDVRQRFERFGETFGERPSAEITAGEIERWLESLDLNEQSYNNCRGRVFGMFQFAVQRELLDSNPARKIEPKTVRPVDTQVIQPEELQRLLEGATGELLPALAISYFSVLRAAEILRLNWPNVKLERGFIEVPASRAKSAKRRLVPIESNLAQWLAPYAEHTGKLYPYSKRQFHAQLAGLCKRMGVERVDNSGHHSFASYWLAIHHDSAALASRLGHSTSKLVFNVYRELVDLDAAAAYWKLRPKQAPSNVIALGERTCG